MRNGVLIRKLCVSSIFLERMENFIGSLKSLELGYQ